MKKFLEQPEATFYHITPIENWEGIKNNGLISTNGRLFVSRVGEFPVLMAIAFQQIPELYYSNGIVILKLPQAKNNFKLNEIKRDNQSNEWTRSFQNIVLRKYIPIENIEFMMELRFGNAGPIRDMFIEQLSAISEAGRINDNKH